MKFQVKSIFVKTLLILLATSFVLFGILNFFNGVGNTNILKINNNQILISHKASVYEKNDIDYVTFNNLRKWLKEK